MTLETLRLATATMRSKYEQGQGQVALLTSQTAETQARLVEVAGNLSTWRQVQVLLTQASEFAREQLVARVQQTVTAALQAVFGEEGLEFRIQIATRAGQPTADWEIVSLYGDQQVAGEPESCRGGGLVDVISIALRLALLEIARPRPQGPVILDEPGKHLSATYAPNLALFLRQYARQTGRQILLVTHTEDLAEVADISYQVSKVHGASQVEEVQTQ